MSERLAGAMLLCGVLLGGDWNGPLEAATIPPPELGPYQVIRAERAVIRHGNREMAAPAVLYDGTGLTDDNPLLASHVPDPDTIWQYPIESGEYPVAVEFELDADYLINEMWVWQLQGDATSQGLLEFDIVMRDAAYREVGIIEGAIEDFKRVGIQPVQRFNAFGECVFLPIPDCVRFIELRIHRNLGDPGLLGLAEVAFAGRRKLPPVPEPSTLALTALAMGGGLVGARRCGVSSAA